jgi:hypothetical protein
VNDRILDVPYYRQNSDNGLDPFWRDRSCGILALKMVIDFYRRGQHQPDIDLGELFDRAMSNGGVDDNGNWLHSALVKTARDYGFRSWRRMWRLSGDQRARIESEGADSATLERNELQQMREAMPTLVETVDMGFPVIISVAKNFDDVEKPHLVVLTGVRRSAETNKYQGFFYNDPYSPSRADRKDRYVALARFIEKWNYLAIFTEPIV